MNATRKPVITVIGAASTTFGPKVLRDLLNHHNLWGSDIRFVDINEDRLAIYEKLARAMGDRMEQPITVTSTTDRRAVLAGSDYVIISVDTGHYTTWEMDFTIPKKHGIRQVLGELGGPGGLFHSLRQIPLHLEIAHDIEELCPDAVVLLASNPLNRLCLTMERHANVGRVYGLCHGVEMATNLYLNHLLDIPGEELDVIAAGTNHMTWILDLRRSGSGEDLYPRLKELAASGTITDQTLSWKLLDTYGYFPATLDNHVGEYIPYAWEFHGTDGIDFKGHLQQELDRWEYLRELSEKGIQTKDADVSRPDQSVLSEELRLGGFLEPRNWADTLAMPLIDAWENHGRLRMNALNAVNHGAVDTLPEGVFVETPAIVDGGGVQPIHVDLPKPLAAFCRRDIDQMELIVEAGVTGSRRLALQAMLLDPVVDSVSAAEKILDEMLQAQSEYLPQF
jgi:alpha-galactosidase